LQRLALLSRITHAIGERQDLRSIFQAWCARSRTNCRSTSADQPVRRGANQSDVSCVGVNTEPLRKQIGLVQEPSCPIDENGLARCVQGHLVYEPDIPPRASNSRASCASRHASLVIAPLLVESQVFGVLICARRADNAFVSGECEFLRQVSEHTRSPRTRRSCTARCSGLRRPAPDPAAGHAAGTAARARQMASGIAHDINNAISPMSLYTEALLERETQLTERGRGSSRPSSARSTTWRDGGAHGRVLSAARAARLAAAVDLNMLGEHVVDLTRARWSDMAAAAWRGHQNAAAARS
jgi:hypothetical protein